MWVRWEWSERNLPNTDFTLGKYSSMSSGSGDCGDGGGGGNGNAVAKLWNRREKNWPFLFWNVEIASITSDFLFSRPISEWIPPRLPLSPPGKKASQCEKKYIPMIVAMQCGPMMSLGHRYRWRRCRNNAIGRRRRCGQWRCQRRRLPFHVLAGIFVVDQGVRVGRLASQQMDESASKRAILPRINDRIHARIGHGQRKCGLIVVRRTIDDKLKDSRTRHDKVRQPANGETAQYQYDDLSMEMKRTKRIKKPLNWMNNVQIS